MRSFPSRVLAWARNPDPTGRVVEYSAVLAVCGGVAFVLYLSLVHPTR